MPTTLLGAVPHAVTQDDTYKGYILPKGAGVMNNVWAINMDPHRAPKPRTFDPDRCGCPINQTLHLRLTLTLFDYAR